MRVRRGTPPIGGDVGVSECGLVLDALQCMHIWCDCLLTCAPCIRAQVPRFWHHWDHFSRCGCPRWSTMSMEQASSTKSVLETKGNRFVWLQACLQMSPSSRENLHLTRCVPKFYRVEILVYHYMTAFYLPSRTSCCKCSSCHHR